ncbi:MAG: single-stranded DNA-binding protein [Bacillota bacterium]|nr:single-stranded DNA-binding protein [Bacillota bacterium]
MKGRRISVTGKISVRSVQREDETRRYFTDIIADNIEFLESGKAAVNEF